MINPTMLNKLQSILLQTLFDIRLVSFSFLIHCLEIFYYVCDTVYLLVSTGHAALPPDQQPLLVVETLRLLYRVQSLYALTLLLTVPGASERNVSIFFYIPFVAISSLFRADFHNHIVALLDGQ